MNKASSYHFFEKINFPILALLCALMISISPVLAENNPAADSTKLYKYDLKYVGSSTTIDANYRYVIEDLIDILKENLKATIHIRGHVCCGPSVRISFKRARKVFKYLVQHGIARQRITFKGYSDEIPIAYPEKNEQDEFVNRRVDFIINYHK